MRTEWLDKEQHAQSRALWEEAFPEDSAAFLDTYYAGKGFENEISVIRDETGVICSMIHWNPRTFCFYGHDVPSAYLVAVATKKEYRRHGLMRRLMTDGLHACERRGLPFVFLTPVSDVYYTPFGFSVVSDAKTVRLDDPKEDGGCRQKDDRDAVSDGANKRGAYEVRTLRPAEYTSAARWCNMCLSGQYTYFIRRDADYFTSLAMELASEGGGIMAVYAQEKEYTDEEERAAYTNACHAKNGVKKQQTESKAKRLAGIFLYTTEGGMEVREPVCMLADRQLVYDAICGWVSQKEVSLTAVTMVRILSLEKCVACLRSKEQLEQRIHVSDPLFAHNNGEFLLRLSPDGCSLTRIEVSDNCGPVCSGKIDAGRKKKATGVTEKADCLCYTIGEITDLLFAGGYQNEIV